jgi:hypothetical protein
VKRGLAPVPVAVVLTLACVAALATGAPGGLAVRAWLLALGGLGLFTAAFALRTPAGPSDLERALHCKPPKQERPLQLERIERELVLGAGSAFDLHYRLRQTLREIAAQRLFDRQGLVLDETGPDVLTAETWALLRPDREAPSDRHATGIPLARLGAIISELESL